MMASKELSKLTSTRCPTPVFIAAVDRRQHGIDDMLAGDKISYADGNPIGGSSA